MRWFIYLSYNGTAYHGWQVQPNGISVQEVLERSLEVLFQKAIPVTAAGRTDAGVHARQMVAHFDTEAVLPPAFVKRMNSILPRDIAVHDVKAVQADAHARFDALSRSYEYHVHIGKNVFAGNRSVRLMHLPDFEAMNKAAAVLMEYSDFTSFSKLHTDAKTNICKLYKACWIPADEGWVFEISADRFLRNMVRSVVGTLLEVGGGRMNIDELRAVVEAHDRCKAGVSMPAHGLYLTNVSYPENIFLK
ncbi:MAG: tRNA pseudouridine(38-40) synthase TruA [Paludibacter sp.]|nr:tRNA pseudouridine(38-40) synthase TruA [Paludibacter sp.]